MYTNFSSLLSGFQNLLACLYRLFHFQFGNRMLNSPSKKQELQLKLVSREIHLLHLYSSMHIIWNIFFNQMGTVIPLPA